MPAAQVAPAPATKTTTSSGVDRLPTRLAYAAVIPLELTTDRLLLRQWRDEDAEPFQEIYEQPEFLETMPSQDLDDTRAQVTASCIAGRWTGTASGRPATGRPAG